MTSGQTSGYETFGFAPRVARYVRVYLDGTTAVRWMPSRRRRLFTSP